MTQIRKSTPDDIHLAQDITDLVNKIYLDAERNMYKANSTRIAQAVVETYIKEGLLGIAFTDGKLSGVIKTKEMKEKPGTFNFGMFAVDYDFRGDGIGQKLVDYVEGVAKEHGATHMQLEILRPLNFEDVDKERLKKWYTKIGYKFQEGILFQDVYPQHFHKFKTDVIFDVYLKKL